MARDSLFHSLAEGIADVLAEYVARGTPNREAAYLTIMSIFYAKAARVAGGEWVYVPHVNRADREQSRQRIAIALQSGEPATQIARREGVTERHVRKVRGTIRP